MLITRILQQTIIDKLANTKKIIILYGARQVGKTTLVRQILAKVDLRCLSINADEQKYIDVLSSRDGQKLGELVAGYDLLFIDEAQRVPDIGINLKILIDQLPKLKIIATGSSSFELANRISEPLTGRAWTYTLFPISLAELSNTHNQFELKQKAESLLIYGSYPELFSITNQQEKQHYLLNIASSYLFKDIFALSYIKNPHKLTDLLRLIAFQIGSEVSLSELAAQLEMTKDTVERYIDLLEKAFVLFRLSGFSRNLRKEVSKMDKIYFYDLGIRNTLIENFKPLNQRDDIGKLWENYLICERKKLLSYEQTPVNSYFWRTYTGAELDYVEEREGKLFGYEIKYQAKKLSKPPQSWLQTYPNAIFDYLNKENYLDFCLKVD